MSVQNVMKFIGFLFVGMILRRTIVAGIVKFARDVEIGENGIVINATNVPMVPLFPANAAHNITI